MGDKHPPTELLERLAEGNASREERKRVVRHLLGGCRECARALATLESLDPLTGIPRVVRDAVENGDAGYEEVFDRLLTWPQPEAMEKARDPLRGLGLLAALFKLPAGERLTAIRDEGRFVCRPLFDRLLCHVESLWLTNRADALLAAALAVPLAEALHKVDGTEVRARAYATLGNSRRLTRDFAGAAEALREARRIQEETAAGPRDRAELLGREASLKRNLGKWEEAVAILEQAALIFEELEDVPMQGYILLEIARTIGFAQPDRGVELLKHAMSAPFFERTPRLELSAQFHLAWFLEDDGRPQEALIVFETARDYFAAFSEPSTRFQLLWLEARIAAALGEHFAAEQVLLSLAGAALEQARFRDLFLVTLDLVKLYALRGDRRRASEGVATLFPVLLPAGVHPQGTGIWVLFESDIKTAADPAASVRAMAEYFRRHFFVPNENLSYG